ncbi:MAG TPA: hypothetical protein VJ715_08075 [Pyrinomonadaceae bacterium]|nr:hypothetical protein [Pyrinomonadaceae bacterium]
MSEQSVTSRPVHENLDTAYVNLAALVRYLQERYFAGRIHVVLDEYEADVFLGGTEPPRVRETNHATGLQAEGEEALKRLLVRAREPGGVINVYDHSRVAEQKSLGPAPPAWVAPARSQKEPEELRPEDLDWSDLVRVSGELIGTIERAALATGADFAGVFRAVCREMADDYPFLDPGTGRFEYGNSEVWLRTKPTARAYVSGISEALRRVVSRISTGPRANSVRERVALELAVLARRQQAHLARFKFSPQLDRIAGTRVL